MLSTVVSRLDDIERLKRGDIIYPSFVDLHSSDKCNQSCLGCAYTNINSGGMMPEDQHKKALETFLGVGVRAFDFAGGGEPTLLPYLNRHMNMLARNKAHFALITNGTHLSEVIEPLVKYGTYCRISLEGTNVSEYSSYKRVSISVWKSVLKQISSLVAERNKAKSSLEISLKFSVGKNLCGPLHYTDGILLGRSLGVDHIQFKALRHQPEELTDSEKEDEYKHLQRAIEFRSSNGFVRSWIRREDRGEIPQCWLNPFHTVMDWKGDLFLCCYYYYRFATHKIGNIFEQVFKDIWLAKEHREKISCIKKEECSQVDCKFFAHHHVAERHLKNGQYWFL